MGSTFLSLHYHIVFSTKERHPFIRDEWRAEFFAYLGGTVRGLDGIPETIGGVADHVHLLIGLRATHCMADFMRGLKKAGSAWAGEHHEPEFRWQDGYAAFTVSVSNIPAVKDYINRQAEHHQRISFRDELVKLLEKHGVQYDSKFLLG